MSVLDTLKGVRSALDSADMAARDVYQLSTDRQIEDLANVTRAITSACALLADVVEEIARKALAEEAKR